MSMDVERHRLFSAHKTVTEHWHETAHSWRDNVRREFEKDFWSHIEPGVQATVAALDRLGQAMIQARQECG